MTTERYPYPDAPPSASGSDVASAWVLRQVNRVIEQATLEGWRDEATPERIAEIVCERPLPPVVHRHAHRRGTQKAIDADIFAGTLEANLENDGSFTYRKTTS